MAKKNMRNEFEFMSAVLDALGVEYEEADIKQREKWRSKVLDGWGVEYELDDLKQFERWRKKCLEGLGKNGGGGGITVKSLSVTENGTYTAPTGKAYSPVTVNVSGGGSSDFSTATVTLISDNGNQGRFIVSMPSIDNIGDNLYGDVAVEVGESQTVTAVLYKSKLIIDMNHGYYMISTSRSTGAYTINNGYLVITGDCTLVLLDNPLQ